MTVPARTGWAEEHLRRLSVACIQGAYRTRTEMANYGVADRATGVRQPKFERPVVTAQEARAISRIGAVCRSEEESLLANGFAPNRNGGYQGFLRKAA